MLARGALTDNTGQGTFITIFKKGRRDDYGNYRLINLLNHSYKVLSSLLLLRLIITIYLKGRKRLEC